MKIIKIIAYFSILLFGFYVAVMNAEAGVLEEILVEASCAGNYDRIKKLLSLDIKIDLNAKDKNGDNPLICAVARKHNRIVELLLDHGASPDITNKRGDSLIVMAINQNNPAMAKMLIKKGADPNILDKWGLTPLFHAACLGDLDIANVLITNGADVNAIEKTLGETVLIKAISKFRSAHPSYPPISADLKKLPPCPLAQIEMVKFLLENGADVRIRSKNNGNTALHFAAERNYVQIIPLLIDFHADVNAINNNRETALFLAAQAGMSDAVEVLLQYDADPDIPDKSGVTPLLTIIRTSSTSPEYLQALDETAEVLIKSGASLDFTDKYKRTYLMLSAESGKAKIIQMLLSQSKHLINAKDGQGLTALMYAAKSQHYQSAKALVKSGAKIYLKDSMGKTALMYGVNSKDITALFLDNGAKINDTDRRGFTPLMQAVDYENIEVIRELINRGAKINTADHKEHQSSLMLAIYKRNIEIVNVLLDKGADVHLKDVAGQSAIFIAAFRGLTEIISVLLDHGSLVDPITSQGVTPLMAACQNGYPKTVELLLKKGANINAASKLGWSPLFYAVFYGHYDICKILIEKGAQTQQTDNNGRRLSDLAKEKGLEDILILLNSIEKQ
ncbi:MAG: hypothetical protein DRP79_02980 [Planctomycetota bacterium]|nr:MAG: hypothetical protein DRP79_02980 [Planctomycetota bacterium]